MLEQMTRHWWTLTLRGVLAIVFAVLVFLSPIGTGLVLVLFFGAYALVDGVLALIAAARMSHANENWQPLIIEGVLGILFGIIAFSDPAALAIALVYVVAAWAILTGIAEIVAAVRLRRAIADEVWLIVTGIVSLIFGIVLLANPLMGFGALAWILGAYALLFGLLLIALSLRLRGIASRLGPPL